MIRLVLLCLSFVVASLPITAQEVKRVQEEQENKQENTAPQQVAVQANEMLGMNVRGNKESPLTLTIVPWRSAAHNKIDPEIRPGWRPQLKLLQPEAYRRNINAFLKSRKARMTANSEGGQNENQ